MNGKVNERTAGNTSVEIDERLWRSLYHKQYATGIEGRIRREYMDLAKPDFYPKILEVANVHPYATVLDLGCGDGTDIVLMKQEGHKGLVVGVETPVPEDPEATEFKVERIEQNLEISGIERGRVELKIGYAEELDYPDESFDVIWVANTLQHCFDIDRVLDNIFRMLKTGGKLVAVTNHVDNKPLHHGLLEEMAAKINGMAPEPFSSKFNSETGPKKMAAHRHQFRKTDDIVQKKQNNLRLTKEEIPHLLLSLSSYWSDIMPPNMRTISRDDLIEFLRIQQERRTEILEEIREDLENAIESSPHGAVYETIKRVAYVYEKRPVNLFSYILQTSVHLENLISGKIPKVIK